MVFFFLFCLFIDVFFKQDQEGDKEKAASAKKVSQRLLTVCGTSHAMTMITVESR